MSREPDAGAPRGLAAVVESRIARRVRRGIASARRFVQGPPMLRDRYMELEVGSWTGATQALDAEGRLLGEEFGLAPSETELPNTVWRTWKAAGSRQGKLYNLTALHSVSKHWVHVLSDVRLIQQRYLVRFGSSDTLADLYHLARIATAVPAYLMRRRHDRVPDGRLPARHAAVYKTMAGLHLTIDAMIGRDARLEDYQRPEPRRLLEYIESTNLFVATTGRVCGGPEKMVEELIACALGRPLAADLPDVEPPIFAPDLDRVIDYGVACARLELAHQIFAAEYRRRVEAVDSALEGSAPAADAATRPDSEGARLACRIFDRLAMPAGTDAQSFRAVRPESAAARALDRSLEAELQLHSDAARRAVCAFLLTRARAHRAFCELFESAMVALGQGAASMPPWRMVEARMARTSPAARTPASDWLARLPLVQQGAVLFLRAPAGRRVSLAPAE